MNVAKERMSSSQFLPVWVRHEHTARYRFAAQYVAGKVVVDCACGDGTSSELFANSGAATVHAIDVSQETVDRAAQDHVHPNLTFKAGDAMRLPFADASIDVYISLETIEHLPKDGDYLHEAARVLKSDGIFICSTPNRDVTNPGKTLGCKPWNTFHVREYNTDEFTTLLSGYFDAIEMHGQNPTQPTYVQLMQRVGRFLPFNGAVRINQVFKLPRMLSDSLEDHAVLTPDDELVFEYCVAVCRKPLLEKGS